MSRIGKKIIELPGKVEIAQDANNIVSVKEYSKFGVKAKKICTVRGDYFWHRPRNGMEAVKA